MSRHSRHNDYNNDSESVSGSESVTSASESYSEAEQKHFVTLKKSRSKGSRERAPSKKISPEPKEVMPAPKKRAPYRKKYQTAEEAHSARLEQMRKWRQNRKDRSLTITLPDKNTRGELLKVLGFVHSKVEITPALEQSLGDLIQQMNAQNEQREQ